MGLTRQGALKRCEPRIAHEPPPMRSGRGGADRVGLGAIRARDQRPFWRSSCLLASRTTTSPLACAKTALRSGGNAACLPFERDRVRDQDLGLLLVSSPPMDSHMPPPAGILDSQLGGRAHAFRAGGSRRGWHQEVEAGSGAEPRSCAPAPRPSAGAHGQHLRLRQVRPPPLERPLSALCALP